MEIRPLTLADLPALGRLKEPWTLNLDRQLIQPVSSWRMACASLMPYQMAGACTLVCQDSSLLACIQAEGRPRARRWSVLHMAGAPRLAAEPQTPAAAQEGQRVFTDLLAELCRQAARNGTGLVFASVVERAAMELFGSVGFAPYAEETFYRMVSEETREEEVPRLATVFAIRPQRSRDVWGIQGLYSAVTPRATQLVESLDSDAWEAPPSGWRARLTGKREERLILEVEAGVRGYLRLVPGVRGYWLEMMIHPQHRDLAAHLLQAGLCLVSDTPLRPVYCALRGYQSELGGVLESAGFRAMGSQSLLVKQMAVRVRQRQSVFQPVMERALEPARTLPFAGKPENGRPA